MGEGIGLARRTGCGIKYALGLGLMALGVVIRVCFIPFWAWLCTLGMVLIVLGIICVWG